MLTPSAAKLVGSSVHHFCRKALLVRALWKQPKVPPFRADWSTCPVGNDQPPTSLLVEVSSNCKWYQHMEPKPVFQFKWHCARNVWPSRHVVNLLLACVMLYSDVLGIFEGPGLFFAFLLCQDFDTFFVFAPFVKVLGLPFFGFSAFLSFYVALILCPILAFNKVAERKWRQEEARV